MGVLLDRYLAGDCEAVWRELLAYGGAIRTNSVLTEAEEIAAETMRRAKANIQILLTRLPEIGYKLKYPLHAAVGEISAYSEPSAGVDVELLNFEKTVGPIPLSIKAWYRQIGTVCLCWDLEAEEPLPREWWGVLSEIGSEFEGGYLDPLVVWPPDYTLNEVETEEPFVGDDGLVRYAVSMSPDYYHKDETSGGWPYCFGLPDPAADSKVLYEPHDMMFVEYLRMVFSWGGFPGFEKLKSPRPESLKYLCEAMTPL